MRTGLKIYGSSKLTASKGKPSSNGYIYCQIFVYVFFRFSLEKSKALECSETICNNSHIILL
jgi:hypothetical protein